jgi:hypothetical protein
MEERLSRLRAAAWEQFRRAERLMSEYEEGRYKGEDVVLDFWALLPVGCTNTCIRGLHDAVLAQKIYELRNRFQGLLDNVP